MIVGVAQANHRDGDAEPIAMMAAVVEAALADAGPAVAPRVQAVRAIGGIWPYRDPARQVAARLGLDRVATGLTRIGGNEAYDAVRRTGEDLAAGRIEAAVICSAEHLRSRRTARAEERRFEFLPEDEAAEPDVTYGLDQPMVDPAETAAGVGPAVNFYAAAEVALRHRRHESPAGHAQRVAALWARASEVAATNPHAWLRDAASAAAIGTVGPRNRMVAYPYPKLMTSNINVDQAAAVVLCTAAVAEDAGVPRDQWVFPLAATGATDTLHMTRRRSLDDSPAMRIAGPRALELAATGPGDVGLVDLYSCFPVAVQLGQEAFGLAPDRPFTVTGGLTFAGGPLNSYCLHALGRAVELLRASDAGTALLSGNGGYFSKHSFLVLGSSPPAQGFRSEYVDVSDHLDPRPAAAGLGSDGTSMPGTIDAYTVTYSREGEPDLGVVAVIDDADARTWANTRDPELLASLLGDDLVGATVRMDHRDDVPRVELVD